MCLRGQGPLPSQDTLRAMRLSLPEGIAYALMVGFGETYFLAVAALVPRLRPAH